MYNSVHFSKRTELWNHRHSLILEPFHELPPPISYARPKALAILTSALGNNYFVFL